MSDVHFALAACERLLRSDRLNVKALCDMGRELLRLNRATESRKCYKAAVEAMMYAMRIGHVDAAQSFEVLIHGAFVAPFEDEEHYYRCYSDWRSEMARFGRRFRETGMPVSTNIHRIGFILPTGTLLGHTEVLFNFLRESAVLERLGVAAHVYVPYECDNAFVERARREGVPVHIAVHELPQGDQAPELARLAWLRARLAENDCGTAVWVTAAQGATFMLSAGVAPVQIFWALRFHPISGPFIDGYVSYGPAHRKTKTIGKTPWQVCPVPLALEAPGHGADEVAALRARFPERVLAGTLARTEKIDSKPFLQSVVRILQANADAGYVWTGRKQHPGIQAFFETAGVAERCHFVGWVDTALYAQALDVFLETFPVGCGITGYQALGAGTALVSYYEENTLFGMAFGTDEGPDAADAHADGPLLCARSADEYVALAGRLIADEAFRQATGSRGQAFFGSALDNGEHCATRFFETLISIAEGKLRAQARAAPSTQSARRA